MFFFITIDLKHNWAQGGPINSNDGDDKDEDCVDYYDNNDDDDDDFKKYFFCRIITDKAPIEFKEVIYSFFSTYSGYGKSRPACTKAGPQSFFTS